ncbi:MAG: hypothetical protein H7245_16495 [Candidatus Saccharibacteria bacterium]|nr:hypothetical protein [Pseudorhodobacter sp.]
MATKLLKANLKRKGMSYSQLVKKLAAMGIDKLEVNGQLLPKNRLMTEATIWGLLIPKTRSSEHVKAQEP